jgi:hypothetical protein
MRAPPPTSRRHLPVWRTFLAALALGSASAAQAVSISNLSVFLDPGNTPDLLDTSGPAYAQIDSDVGVQSSSATQFTTRYQAGVYADTELFGATTIITLSAAYTISFDIIDAVSSSWQLDIDTSRVGARTAVSDSFLGPSAFSLGAVTGLLGGAGSLSSGSLGLTAIPRAQQTGDVNIAFGQNGSAIITGSGNGSISLSFAFTATAESIDGGFGAGDEAGIRMGIPDSLPESTAGAYPGAGSRNAAADGHFVDLTLIDLGPIPEPDTALLLGIGLGVLAVQGRRRKIRQP